MKKYLFTTSTLLILTISSLANNYNADSVTAKKPSKLSVLGLNIHTGLVLPTNDFISKSDKKPTFTSFSLRYGFASTGESWQDYAYGMPYGGIGIMYSEFYDKKSLGNPYTLYAFQGTTITKFSQRVKLNFEWNLGASFNWRPYDPFDNPDNIALGSSTNVYVGVNLYANFRLSKNWDLKYGFALSHYSNGASRLPNKGINLISTLLEMNYNFNRTSEIRKDIQALSPPQIEPRLDFDLLVNISSRQRRFDTTGTSLPSEYIDKNFSVYGISFAPMIVKNYKFRYGLGLDLLYDESSGSRAWRELNPSDNKLYDRVKLGKFQERISLGISAKGELVMPMYSIFANLGYNVIHGNKKDKRIYEVIGVKAYLKENLFGTFGIRASNFSRAQYLYWSLGYTFEGKPLKQVRKSFLAKINKR